MPRSTGFVERPLRTILRAEGLAVSVLAVGIYSVQAPSWRLFLVLVLLPDLSFLGYGLGPRIGALAYNAAHSYVGPVVLAFLGAGGIESLIDPALIWASHIGFDRALGYGLKYPTAFGDTHLGPVRIGGN